MDLETKRAIQENLQQGNVDFSTIITACSASSTSHHPHPISVFRFVGIIDFSFSSKKRASSSKKKASKKPRPLVTGSLFPKDMHQFRGVEQKIRYENFKTRPIVPSRVVNLNQLKDSNCPIKLIRLFYANFRISFDSGELETLVLGNRIIVNDLLFEDVFGTKISGAKRAVAKPDSDLSDFGPLSLYFEHRILAHIVTISLIPRKGYLSNISTRDEFVLYYLLRKYRIN
ncbi:hypothetical protein H5410_056323 [Solanum commersonii]|uniref:Uncharacterized protein n=1 Tax=Solanum commersonii TaxID=4109 RepID=A0A9J5WLE0_SOLCO|nr:hypothetical protein H5410_056323 [Solanum commersonii]